MESHSSLENVGRRVNDLEMGVVMSANVIVMHGARNGRGKGETDSGYNTFNRHRKLALVNPWGNIMGLASDEPSTLPSPL